MSNAIATTNHCLKLTIFASNFTSGKERCGFTLGHHTTEFCSKSCRLCPPERAAGGVQGLDAARMAFISPGPMPSPAHTPPLSTPMKIKADKQPMQDKFPLFPNHKPNPEALDSWSGQSL